MVRLLKILEKCVSAIQLTTRKRSDLWVSIVLNRCFWCRIGRAMFIYIQSKTEFQTVVRCCILTSFTCSKLDGRAETRMFLSWSVSQTSFKFQKSGISHLLWYWERFVFEDFQCPRWFLFMLITQRVSGNEERKDAHFSWWTSRPVDREQRFALSRGSPNETDGFCETISFSCA